MEFTSNMKNGWLWDSHPAWKRVGSEILIQHEKELALRFSSSMKKSWLWETVLSWTVCVCKPCNDIRSGRMPIPERSKRTIRLCPLDRCYWDPRWVLQKTIDWQVNGQDAKRQKLWCGSCQEKNTFLAERECWWYNSVRRYSIVIISCINPKRLP